MRALRLALRMLGRDWRAGELTVLVAALVLAVGSVGTVTFFADRVKTALARQANLLLGADAVISADRPLPEAYADEATERRLVTTQVLKFNSMVQKKADSAGAPLLADVKAVAAGYPLRSAIVLVDTANPAGRVATGIPPAGSAWPDARLAQRLGLSLGDPIVVGEATLTVDAIVQQEPEVTSGLLALGPRLLLNTADVAATNLLQPGNRATWRLLVADVGEHGTLADYIASVQGKLEPGQRLETIRDLRPEVRMTLERAEKFLGLAALVAVILAAAAVALAASRYLRRHLDAAAMLRCLGASERQALTLFTLQFGVLGVAACLVGIVVALAGQQLLALLLGSITQASLPAPGWLPGVLAGGTGLVLLFGFALPPLVALAAAPPLRVLRRDLPRPRPAGFVAYLVGIAVILGLIGWQAQDAKTAGIVTVGLVGLVAVATAAAWALLVLIRRLPQRGVTWRFGVANLGRRPLASSLQIGALALGLMALLLLVVVRGDLLTNWRTSLPPDAPNHFLINVMPDQVDGLRALVARETGSSMPLYPMIRGRLVQVNGAPLDRSRLGDERARRLAEREFNLSWATELPRSNQLVAGEWWGDARGVAAGISLEDGIATTLGLKIGDELRYDVAGTPVTARITSLRKVAWDSFRPNFFALFAPGVLEAMPTTYLGAVMVPAAAEAAGWLPVMLRDYPNVLAIDVGEVIRQVQAIIDQVARAVEFVFLFTLAGGLLVLQAVIAATQDERRFDAAVMRTLGASQKQLAAAQLAEFLVLGMLAGALAAGGATAIGALLADRVFQIPFAINPLVWLYGIVGGAVAVTIAGWLGTRGTLRQTPLEALRALA